jgi:hypothetical protein
MWQKSSNLGVSISQAKNWDDLGYIYISLNHAINFETMTTTVVQHMTTNPLECRVSALESPYSDDRSKCFTCSAKRLAGFEDEESW